MPIKILPKGRTPDTVAMSFISLDLALLKGAKGW